MNTMPIADLKISSASLPVPRTQSSPQAQEGADFSKSFQESLDAISREDEPSVGADKPVEKKPIKASNKHEQEPSDESRDGQNVPVDAGVVPANVAGMMPLAALGPEVIDTALQSATAAKGTVSGGLATDKAVLVQAMAAAANAADKGSVRQGEVKLPTMTNGTAMANKTISDTSGVLSAGVSSQMALVAEPAGAAVSAGSFALDAPAPVGGVVAAQAKVAIDDGASASQALLQPQQVAQTTSVPIPKQATDLALAQAKPEVMAQAGEVTADVASGVSVGGKREPAALQIQGSAELTFADKALANTVFAQAASAGGVSADYPTEPPLALDARLSLPMAKDDAIASVDDAPVAAKPDDAVPLGGLGAALSGNQIGGAVSTPAAVAPPVAPAVMVPAAHLNHELVKFAGAGGGRAVMEITSPDLGALKIDLSIDGKGVARMVVEASTSAARDQLEQGMRQLHDDFAGLGLSLNVDLRQGGGSAYQRDAATDAWGSGSRGVASATADRGASVASTAGAARVADEKSRVHFYA